MNCRFESGKRVLVFLNRKGRSWVSMWPILLFHFQWNLLIHDRSHYTLVGFHVFSSPYTVLCIDQTWTGSKKGGSKGSLLSSHFVPSQRKRKDCLLCCTGVNSQTVSGESQLCTTDLLCFYPFQLPKNLPFFGQHIRKAFFFFSFFKFVMKKKKGKYIRSV